MPAQRGPRYIAVEGPIGAGKTTLARRLARAFDAEPLLEAPFENPFLARFYEHPRAWALSAQLSFLLQRAGQMRALREGWLFRTVTVSDFMLEKDRLFARMNLDTDELTLYEQVYSHVIDEVPSPDLVIYLQAPVEVLRTRVTMRGVPYEQNISVDYLSMLSDAYTRYFSRSGASVAPRVLVVDSSQLDFVHHEAHFNCLFDAVMNDFTGTMVLNPGFAQ